MKCETCGVSCACEPQETKCSNHSSQQIPDYDLALTAWRCFSLSPLDTLRSENGTMWPARKRFEAVCNAGSRWEWEDDGHSVLEATPSLTCSCGVYAYKRVVECFKHSGFHADIISVGKTNHRRENRINIAFGQVYLWGRIVEHEIGYRAQYAYPKELATPDEKVARALERVYGIPVAVFNVSEYIKRVVNRRNKVIGEL